MQPRSAPGQPPGLKESGLHARTALTSTAPRLSAALSCKQCTQCHLMTVYATGQPPGLKESGRHARTALTSTAPRLSAAPSCKQCTQCHLMTVHATAQGAEILSLTCAVPCSSAAPLARDHALHTAQHVCRLNVHGCRSLPAIHLLHHGLVAAEHPAHARQALLPRLCLGSGRVCIVHHKDCQPAQDLLSCRELSPEL